MNPVLFVGLIIFLVFLLFFFVYSFFLIYHIVEFSMNPQSGRVLIITYLVISALMLVVSAVALFRVEWNVPLTFFAYG